MTAYNPLQAPQREILTVEQLASRLDKRLYMPKLSDDDLRAQCAKAVSQGLGAVITLPERVPAASELLNGSGVGLVTAVSWHTQEDDRYDSATLRSETQSLTERGATEIAYVISEARVAHDDGREVLDQVADLVEVTQSLGAKVRLLLATDHLTPTQIERFCQDAASAGVWMVQGGSWRGRRTGISQMQRIRAALPPNVLLKWTEPIKGLETILLCTSLGVDRFNCDVDQILENAHRAARMGPLTIPSAGLDY